MLVLFLNSKTSPSTLLGNGLRIQSLLLQKINRSLFPPNQSWPRNLKSLACLCQEILALGFLNTTKSVTESSRTSPFLRRLGHFPGLQRPKLCWTRPALGYRSGAGLPCVSSPEDSPLYGGQVRLHLAPKRLSQTPRAAGSPWWRPGPPP